MDSLTALGHLQFLDKYDGRKDLKDWLRAFNKYAIACDWSNDKRLNIAFVCLKGKADKWLTLNYELGRNSPRSLLNDLALALQVEHHA